VFHLQLEGVAGLQKVPHLHPAAAAIFSGLANRASARAKEFAGLYGFVLRYIRDHLLEGPINALGMPNETSSPLMRARMSRL
jgi:hypothetical protein